MPTILSRFDMIFIVKDIHDQGKDMVRESFVDNLLHKRIFIDFFFLMQRLAKHVMAVHTNAARTTQVQEGELTLNFLKKYIAYCKRYGLKIRSWS